MSPELEQQIIWLKEKIRYNYNNDNLFGRELLISSIQNVEHYIVAPYMNKLGIKLGENAVYPVHVFIHAGKDTFKYAEMKQDPEDRVSLVNNLETLINDTLKSAVLSTNKRIKVMEKVGKGFCYLNRRFGMLVDNIDWNKYDFVALKKDKLIDKVQMNCFIKELNLYLKIQRDVIYLKDSFLKNNHTFGWFLMDTKNKTKFPREKTEDKTVQFYLNDLKFFTKYCSNFFAIWKEKKRLIEMCKKDTRAFRFMSNIV